MLFMSIYTYEPSQRNAIVKRAQEKGNTYPPGVKVVGDYIDISGGRIFTLFEADNPSDILVSNYAWSDLGKIELVAVMETPKVMEAIKGT